MITPQNNHLFERPPLRRRRLAGITAAVTAATAIVVSSAVADTPVATATPQGCPPVQILMIPGTTETSPAADPAEPRGLLRGVGEPLAHQFGPAIDIHWLPYDASAFDKGKSYAESKATGMAAGAEFLQARATACSNTKFAIAGYSQGADIAGDLAWLIGHDKLPHLDASRIIAVGLVSDPRRSDDDGATTVGPTPDGTGIAGPRPGGFGTTAAVVRTYCAPGDLYCATDADQDGLLAGLGRILSQPASASPNPPATGALQQALTSDYSTVDLPALAGNLDTLREQVTSPTPDANAVTSATTTIANTLAPLADTSKWVTDNPAVTQSLTTAAPDTPEHTTSDVIDKLKHVDLGRALDSLTTIANSTQNTTTATSSPEALTAVDNLSGQLTPLTTTPADQLTTASNMLSILKPSILIQQTTHIASCTVRFATNLPTILDLTINRIPGIVANMLTDPVNAPTKLKELHAAFGDLNHLFEPIVVLAAGLDYATAASLIALIPDPSGAAQIVSTIVGLIGNTDIIGLANIAGRLQELLWHTVETGDILGAAFGALPEIGEFARIVVDTLSGIKTPPTQLGKPSDPGVQSTHPGGDLTGLASSLTALASSSGADALAQLATEGLKAASFFTSNIHTAAYTQDPVNTQGDNTLQDLTTHFSHAITQAAA